MESREVKEEHPCDEECDPLDIGPEFVEVEKRLNPVVVRSKVDTSQAFGGKIHNRNGLQPSVQKDIEISHEDEYPEEIEIKEEIEDPEEIENQVEVNPLEAEETVMTTSRTGRRSSYSTQFHEYTPKTKKLKPHTQGVHQDNPEEVILQHSRPGRQSHAAREGLERLQAVGLETHYPVHVSSTPGKPHKKGQRECIVCKTTERRKKNRKLVTTMCQGCDIGLCLGDCFKHYHTLKNF